MTGRDEVEWARRVPKELIRQLYLSDAAGLLDEALLDEVGTRLYQRCRSILDVEAAKRGRVRCPRCERAGRETIIVHPEREAGLACPVCGWQLTWGEYLRTFKRRQLNLGGAGAAFTGFVRDWPLARTPETKMLAVDRLIHAFHFSILQNPGLPSRPAGVNLINGKQDDVIRFLNELTFGAGSTPGLEAVRHEWQQTLETYHRDYRGFSPDSGEE